MSQFFHSYIAVGLSGLLAVLIAVGGLQMGRTLRPSSNKPARAELDQKSMTYESGVDPSEGGWSQAHVRYYLYALLFVVFDVEVAFIVPWAVQVEHFSTFGLVEMFVFVAILALGLAYAWRKGVFRWDS